MCGIGGVLRIYPPGEPVPPHHESIPDEWLDTLDESIKHRGPDGCGRFRDRTIRPDGTTVDVALVHRRLSIIDHEGGAQPMVHVRHQGGTGELLSQRAATVRERSGTSPTSKTAPSRSGLVENQDLTIDATHLPQGTDLVAVAFNGCIYNHRDLRTELEQRGHRFQTDHADTETLIHGWRAWGLRMQDELDGMYAALIWDRRTGQLAWGRDLVGEKPLYNGRLGPTVFTFSSTAGVHTQMHHVHFTDDMIGIVPETMIETIATGVAETSPLAHSYQDRAGTFFVYPFPPKQGAWNPYQLREIPTCPASRSHLHPSRRSEGVGFNGHGATNQLTPAVTSRLEADAPLGLFLSGGLDSALIAAIARQHRPDIRAFTVRMPVSHLDESAAAAQTAAHLNLDHTIIDCDPNAGKSTPAEDLVHLIEQLGLPFGDSSLLPTHWVCRAARQHIKVALSGDGGDELFGGYRRHTINSALNRYRHLLRLIPDALLDQRKPGSRSTYLARLAIAARHGGYSELLSIFPTPDLRRLIPEIEGERPGDDRFWKVDDPLRHDFLHYLPDDLLRKTDTASMAVGLEVRAPFLARDLVDAALRTPLDVLMPKGQRKGLLKQVARLYLPEHIINRPKQGFAIPIGEWFRSDFGSLRQLLHDHLQSADPFPGLDEAGISINMNYVNQMLREHDRAGETSNNPWHGRDHSQRLYMLLVLSIWAKWLDRSRQNRAKT